MDMNYTHKSVLRGLLALLAVFGMLVAFTSPAAVTVVDQSYNEHSGTFTMTVEATESWAVWRTVDFVNWEKVSPVYRAGRRVFKDTRVGEDLEFAFYVALPATGKPGNRYGWENPRNPHSK